MHSLAERGPLWGDISVAVDESDGSGGWRTLPGGPIDYGREGHGAHLFGVERLHELTDDRDARPSAVASELYDGEER